MGGFQFHVLFASATLTPLKLWRKIKGKKKAATWFWLDRIFGGSNKSVSCWILAGRFLIWPTSPTVLPPYPLPLHVFFFPLLHVLIHLSNSPFSLSHYFSVFSTSSYRLIHEFRSFKKNKKKRNSRNFIIFHRLKYIYLYHFRI